MSSVPETTTLTAEEIRIARESLSRLDGMLEAGPGELRVCDSGVRGAGVEAPLPARAARALREILAEMAQGRPVTMVPVQEEVTTQQAATLLNVSRPYVIGLLEAGQIPYRLVGQHRHVRLDDLLEYRRKDDEARRRIADELAADAQELGMGY
ncbi:helix-turn-helix domain-containing protein [Aquisphaera insulae]|uniref:helix-turn-helix domain-containing protein n=1 Tax=Aquisphaera insulae TaxID=2712864 RepID=UPI0013EB2204|nr:helix-turn-helix domain-containing protein [Aquisphaera insulae]